ncbi:fungal protease inhibitor F [Bombyx mandarina]|uniref:Fungal protease inhibitor F n=1 Tax=Bombyx mandarina TaxID=7092 RepID=A0A6J2JLF4_BOMMA|nr:fungal protease inhibitor F [Bombyx mandarina]
MASKNLFVLFFIFALFAANIAGLVIGVNGVRVALPQGLQILSDTALQCPKNSEVRNNPCPRTCNDPYGQNSCITVIRETCHCKGELVFDSDSICVPISQC